MCNLTLFFTKLPNAIHEFPVCGDADKNSWMEFFPLQWRFLISEVGELKWFSFDLPILKKITKNKSHNNCVNQCPPVIVIGVLCVILFS